MARRISPAPLRPQPPGPSRPTGSPQLEAMLLASAKQLRSHTAEGREPLLTPGQSARVRSSLAAAPKPVSAEVLALAAGFRGEAAPVASALLLRAAAARGDQLKGAGAEKSLGTLRSFAAQLRGLDAATLRERATVLDLDSGKNDSHFDAQGLWERRGTVRAPGPDTAADNDGLLQRFTSTCGTTVLQMLMAEADPVLAFAINQQGRASASADDSTARFQRAVLEEFGGIGIPRLESHLAARLKNGLGQLVRSGEVTPAQRDALVRHATARGPLDARAKTALEAVRQQYGGFPTEAELKRLTAAVLPARDEGLGTTEFQKALEKYASALTGLGYRQTEPADGFGRGGAKKHLDAVEAALNKGADVPFGVSEPAHWMLLTAARRVDGAREFLVSDPDGGRTAWVKEKDFVSGTFGDQQFHLSRPDERPWVDCFYLPTR
ncbi:MAG: hypothetical protein H6Q89_1132 [Myxococcaceae bacterium]|nr:hypothetical protein [Myxococcaceae bacterium]